MFRRAALAVVLALALVAAPASIAAAGSPDHRVSIAAGDGVAPAAGAPSRPLALVYRGPAACAGCAESVAALLRHSPRQFRVAYIGPREHRHVDAAGLRGAAVYAQAGGNDDVGQTLRTLGSGAANAIRDYVAGGGHYLGFCMGAYLAGSDPGIGLLSPADTGEYDTTRGAAVHSARDAIVPVRWGDAVHDDYVQDAPYVTATRVPGERVLARFSNGTIDAAVLPYRRGQVGVVGSHPEADRSWYSARLWRQDRDGLDFREGLELIDAVMRR